MGPAWEQTPGCGAQTRVRKPSLPCARSSRVSVAENGPVPLPREARLSPTSGCADACGRPEAPLTCLACGLCWSRHRCCSPCSAPWGPPQHLGFGLCVYIFRELRGIPSSRLCGLVRASPTYSRGSLPRVSMGERGLSREKPAGAIAPERVPKP